MEKRAIERVLLTGGLLYGAYITATCPCYPNIVSCHMTEFMLTAGLAVGYVVVINRDLFT